MGYKLEDLLLKIESRYPNVFSVTEKVDFINEAIVEIQKEIGVNAIETIPTEEEENIYELPEGVVVSNIIDIFLVRGDMETPYASERRLERTRVNEPTRGYSWSLVEENKIRLYPIPQDDDQTIKIYYKKKTPQLQEYDMQEDLSEYIRDKYITAIIYYVLYIMAEANDDIIKANNYISRYNSDLTKLKLERWSDEGKFPRAKIVDRNPNNRVANFRVPGRNYKTRRR